MQTFFIPKADFEDLIALGLWINHTFDFDGRVMTVRAIGQVEVRDGESVVPLDVEEVVKCPRRH